MLWEENVKKLQLLEQKIVFSKCKYLSMYKPPEYKPPPPQENFFQKGPLTKNKPRGLLSEFYGMYLYKAFTRGFLSQRALHHVQYSGFEVNLIFFCLPEGL